MGIFEGFFSFVRTWGVERSIRALMRTGRGGVDGVGVDGKDQKTSAIGVRAVRAGCKLPRVTLLPPPPDPPSLTPSSTSPRCEVDKSRQRLFFPLSLLCWKGYSLGEKKSLVPSMKGKEKKTQGREVLSRSPRLSATPPSTVNAHTGDHRFASCAAGKAHRQAL